MTLKNKTYGNITVLTIITVMLASPGIINEAYADKDCIDDEKNVGMVTLSLVKAVVETEGLIAGAATENYPAAVLFGISAFGDYATAFGKCSQATGHHSLATGHQTHASGQQSAAFGEYTEAKGPNSAAFGFGSIASGRDSAAFGGGTESSGWNSVAFGDQTTASGFDSTVFGFGNTASGDYSIASGWVTNANGAFTTTFGIHTIAQPALSFVIGQYNEVSDDYDKTNWVPTDPLFVIGNGDEWSRANAFTVLKNGNVGIGTSSPDSPFSLLVNGGTHEVGITQGKVGGKATMELTTADAFDNQATRILIRGHNNTANIEFYSGASGSETQTMHIEGDNGNVGIGTNSPESALQVEGYIQLDTSSGIPLHTDCDVSDEVGRMKVDSTSRNLYVCTYDGTSYDWLIL